MRDEALKIEDRLRAFERAECSPGEFRIGDAHHAAALGAEDRLDDDIAAERFECGDRRVGILTDEGIRNGQAGCLQSHDGQILVDAESRAPAADSAPVFREEQGRAADPCERRLARAIPAAWCGRRRHHLN